jgi:hypothetical protein
LKFSPAVVLDQSIPCQRAVGNMVLGTSVSRRKSPEEAAYIHKLFL